MGKEVKEYPGRLTREEIEKLTVGCEKVEVNVMTRSLKKTVPGDSPASKQAKPVAAATSSSRGAQGAGTSTPGGSAPRIKSTFSTDFKPQEPEQTTTITQTIKSTSTTQQRRQLLSQQQQSSTTTRKMQQAPSKQTKR